MRKLAIAVVGVSLGCTEPQAPAPPELADDSEVLTDDDEEESSDPDDDEGDGDGTDGGNDSNADGNDSNSTDDGGNDSNGSGPMPRETEGDDESSGDGESDGGNASGCVGDQTENIVGQGFVSASSEFWSLLSGTFRAELSVDGDISTSWFSDGPEGDGLPSTYEWYAMDEYCLDRITVVGNGGHSNPDFQQNFGFETMIVTVTDGNGDETFSREYTMEGSPDPTIEIDLDGVRGERIVLSLGGHESEDCGGFAELGIRGRPTE